MSPRTLATIVSVIQWGLAALLLTPFLVFGRSAIFPFIVGKFFIFRAGVELLLAFAVPLWIASPSHRPPRRLTVLLGVFFAAMGLSTIFGVDAHRSFWSNHERMIGMYSLLHFGAYALLLASVYRSWGEWKWYLRAAVAISAVQAVFAVIQRTSGNLFFIQEPGRAWGTLGNYLYLAGYMVFHLYLTYLLWIYERRNIWKIGYVAAALLDFLAFLFADSSGATLAFIASAGTLGFVYAYAKGRWFRVLAITAVVIAIVGGVGLLMGRENPAVQRLPFFGPIAAGTIHGTGATRLMAWQVALEAWKDHPFFGWGVENFYYAFNAHYIPHVLSFGLYETWFDNAHSMYFNTLATMGALGILAYLALIVAPAVFLVRGARTHGIDLHQCAAGCALLAAYAITNLFVFDNFSSYLLFFFLVAYLSAITAAAPGGDRSNLGARRHIARGAFGVALVAASVLIFSTNIIPLRANQASLAAAREAGRDLMSGVRAHKEALKIASPHAADIALDWGRILLDAAAARVEAPPMAIDEAVQALDQVAARHPREVLAYFHKGQLLSIKAAHTGAAADFNAAEEALRRATEVSPRRQQLYFAWARVRQARGDVDGAITLLKEAAAFDETVGQPHFYLAIALAQGGDIPAAVSALDRALAAGFSPGSNLELMMTAEIFRDGKRWNDARKIYESLLVQGSERDPQILFRLLEMTLRLGDAEKAKEYELRLLAILPTAQADVAALKAQLERVRAQIEKEKSAGAP